MKPVERRYDSEAGTAPLGSLPPAQSERRLARARRPGDPERNLSAFASTVASS
jgi:hypothetical protein